MKQFLYLFLLLAPVCTFAQKSKKLFNGKDLTGWTIHGTGHMLGLDVHDCAQAPKSSYREGTLAPGYVLTVEPGLYFQPDDELVPDELRGIGIRIEDDLLVTEDGNVNLSAAMPRTPDDVEDWMARLRG